RARENVTRFDAEIEVKTAERTQLIRQSEHLTKEAADATVQQEGLQKELSAIPVEQLREESKVISDHMEDIRRGAVHWRQFYQALQAERIVTEKTGNAQSELADKEVQLTAAATTLQAVTE